MPVTICDVTFTFNIASLFITGLALVLSWFNRQRLSIMCLGISLLIQSVIALRPPCATILDLRGVPVIGQPAH
jgi:hypothetical protein